MNPISGLWLTWLLCWLVLAVKASPAVRREPRWSRLAHGLPLALCVLLLALPGRRWGLLSRPMFPTGVALYWLGVAMVAIGLVFSVWARLYLGRNWSATVTIKENHQLICRGPYRIVRHPIYTGLLLALAGSAVALDQIRGALSVVIALAALWLKIRVEERLLGETFGQAHARYRSRVRALIPYLL